MNCVLMVAKMTGERDFTCKCRCHGAGGGEKSVPVVSVQICLNAHTLGTSHRTGCSACEFSHVCACSHRKEPVLRDNTALSAEIYFHLHHKLFNKMWHVAG
jgi:hypothetical protein